jgi:hypothetical protein
MTPDVAAGHVWLDLPASFEGCDPDESCAASPITAATMLVRPRAPGGDASISEFPFADLPLLSRPKTDRGLARTSAFAGSCSGEGTAVHRTPQLARAAAGKVRERLHR